MWGLNISKVFSTRLPMFYLAIQLVFGVFLIQVISEKNMQIISFCFMHIFLWQQWSQIQSEQPRVTHTMIISQLHLISNVFIWPRPQSIAITDLFWASMVAKVILRWSVNILLEYHINANTVINDVRTDEMATFACHERRSNHHSWFRKPNRLPNSEVINSILNS